jgi:hypothetical protein
MLVIVIVCILTLRGAVLGLTQDGPTRQQFVTDLSGRIQKDVVPQIEEMGAQALHEVNYQAAVSALNRRTPELAQASIKQVKQLSDDLPKHGQQILNETFVAELKGRDGKIRAMFPNASEQQVNDLVNALATQAGAQAADVSDALFMPHKKALDGIVEDLTVIQDSEAPRIKNAQPTWEMALNIFDVARADLKRLNQPEAATVMQTSNRGNK